MASDDRPRGFLTPDDRDYIRNDREYGTRQQHSNKRRTIRERIKNGILDFPVVHRFDWGQRQRIYADVEYKSGLYRGLVAAVAVAYHVAETGTGDVDFEDLIEDGVRQGIETLRVPHGTGSTRAESGGDREGGTGEGEGVEVDVDPDEISDETLQAVRELPPMIRGDKDKVAIKAVEDVTVDVEYREIPNPVELRRRFLDDEELNHEEVGYLLESGMLDDEEAWAHVEERFREGKQ